jgi:co-chaperonin GroES (HSP10)
MMNVQETGPRSARVTHDSSTCIEADAKIRPLRDQIIVEPLPVILSRTIVVVEKTKPLRGIVKAVGPGCYPKRYDHPDKHQRTRMRDSEVFEPTTVKVGDVVELGGYEFKGYAFPTFRWGDKEHLICREADVSGVLDELSAEQARAEAAEFSA